MENDGQLPLSASASSRPDLISIQNLLALAWYANVKFMVVFLNGSGPRHIYFRWRSTFLLRMSPRLRLAVISHSIYRRSCAKYFLGRTRFQAFRLFLVLNLASSPVVLIAERSWVILGRMEKASLRNCCGHCVFFYVTFYGGRWLFLNYRSTEELSENSLKEIDLQNSAPRFLTSNAPLMYRIVCTILSYYVAIK